MTKEPNIFLSNRLEILYLNLKEHLFFNSTPFQRRLVVVYGPAMQSWLMLKMAQDPDLKVAMGIEFIYLNQALENLTKILQPPASQYLPSYLELALAIEKEIMEVFRSYPWLSATEQELWQPLIRYFKLNPTLTSSPLSLSAKMEKRLITLSQHLAKLFLNYGKFAHNLTTQWEKGPPKMWQHCLWRNLFHERSPWTSLTKVLERPLQFSSNIEIHFFSISFLSHTEFNFIGKISKDIPTYYYLISPCAMFWNDIRSDQESHYLRNFFEKKRYSLGQIDQLEELLRDRNALLANFGRMGREMVGQIQENNCLTHAQYALPRHTQKLDENFLSDELFFYESSDELTLLHAIQADILLMRNPQEGVLFNIETEDTSIQLHKTPNRRREVEILYHNLIGLMHKHPDLEPRDIIVMAPQIYDYIPYIEHAFGCKDSLSDFQILDGGLEVQSKMVQGFLQLLKMSESRWDASNLLQLFEHPAFQRKHQISQEDYYAIREWIVQSGIWWGDDWMHRNELLKRNHCRLGMSEETPIGTWDYGLSRLLLGLTNLLNADSQFPLDTKPYTSIDFSETELLGKWIRILHALRDDLNPLHDGSKMTVEDWANYFDCLLQSYFQPNFEDSQSLDEFHALKMQLDILRSSARTFKKALFPFQSMYMHLNNLLKQSAITYRENHVQAVRFCSLIPLRSIPAKVIAILGMQEGAFPRLEEFSSLNLAVGEKEVDYCPTPVDYDRYLFLEALHSAQDYLLISFQGYDQKDNKELQPSLVVTELFNYLDRHYTVKESKVWDCCYFTHPLNAFDEQYFLAHSTTRNFSLKDYETAKVFYEFPKKNPHCFIRRFEALDPILPETLPNGTLIDIRHLSEVARNPIKFHLNRILEIYLQEPEERIVKKEEDLKISAIDKYTLKRNGLKQSLKNVVYQAEKEGKLPFGLFKTVAINRLSQEIESLHARLKKESVSLNEIFQIEFCPTCREPFKKSENTWRFPPITLSYADNYQIHIVGNLSHATPKGLFAFGKDNVEEIWKIWPQFLAYQFACQLHPTGFEKHLILSEKQTSKSPFFDNPEPYLKQFVRYYALCHQHFSPLMPEWLTHVFHQDSARLQKELSKFFEDTFGTYKSPAIEWILNKNFLPKAEDLIESWQQEAQILLNDLIQW